MTLSAALESERPGVAICSLMRAGSPYEQAYYLQILGLAKTRYRLKSVNLVYDSPPRDVDWLLARLRETGVEVRIETQALQEVHNGTLDDRFAQWAAAINQCINLCLTEDPDLDRLAWIEADLCFGYDTLDLLVERNKDIIAPLVYLNNTFYDSWGFRTSDGRRIQSVTPTLPVAGAIPLEVGSVGSFILYNAAIFRDGLRLRGEYEAGHLVGLCHDARARGYRTFVDPAVTVQHPVTAWLEQTWTLDRVDIFLDGQLKKSLNVSLGARFAGPYEEFVRPILPMIFGDEFRSNAGSSLKITRHVRGRVFDLRIDLAP